jgi:two-component system cell cycle sensor histidine kinase/response regulator CckA
MEGDLRHHGEPGPRESEARYRALFESAPLGIFIFDNAGVITECNARFAAILRAPMSALIGLDLHRLRDQRIWTAFAGVLAGEATRYEGPYVTTYGSEQLHVSMRVTPLRDASGASSGGMGLVEDIAEQMLMRARLLEADRLVSVGTLAAGVAHEINNPLAYMMANLDVIATRRLPRIVNEARALGSDGASLTENLETLGQMIQIVREGAERVREIVRDLKTFSRADTIQRGPIDVCGVLDAAISMAWNEIRHRAKLVKDYGDVPAIHANESRVAQVFVNLLINAAQALPVGDANANTISVRVSAVPANGSEQPERVVVSVTDTGPGIAPEILGRVFDPFFTTKPVGVGTGLGLSICEGIIGALGGTIDVESIVGIGTTFRVQLPIGTPSPSRPISMAVELAPRARRGRILVVDDEIDLVHVMRTALSEEHDVVTAVSGREALELLARDAAFDLILCDVMMPEVSGVDVLRALRTRSPALADRVVFVTGGTFTSADREYLESVANARIDKPFSIQSLTSFVRGAIA